MPQENEWYLVSTHGAFVMFIAVRPECTIREEGRRHHYTVNLDGPFKHPTILQGSTLKTFLGDLVREYSQRQQKSWLHNLPNPNSVGPEAEKKE